MQRLFGKFGHAGLPGQRVSFDPVFEWIFLLPPVYLEDCPVKTRFSAPFYTFFIQGCFHFSFSRLKNHKIILTFQFPYSFIQSFIHSKLFQDSLFIGGKHFTLDHAVVMGVLNITPDSFSDGGRFGEKLKSTGQKEKASVFEYDLDLVVEVARAMVKEGAEILDVGGESSGPGSVSVPAEEERNRVIPVIKRLECDIPEVNSGGVLISVDTCKTEVARSAIEAGASMVNDVTALRGGGEEMACLLAEKRVPVVLMYSKDPSARTTREPVDYTDVVDHILHFFEDRIAFAKAYGIVDEQIILDPGMGAFVSGKAEYSLKVLRYLFEFKRLGYPVLVGPSRKGFIGEASGGLPVSDRLEGSLACVAVCVMNGVRIIRVHDVKESVRVVRMVEAIVRS